MFGFLNVYKPKGMTSHDVVAYLRRITKIKQIGHTGTLDPFAEGVLPIAIGNATRLIEYLSDDKAYRGVIKLGWATSTYDTEGEITRESCKTALYEELRDAVECFRGCISQLPPMYSAIKINGKKLYEYARKGEAVEVKPRAVTISKLEILDYDIQKQEVEIYIECSKGTYIRSLANDIGEKLGTHGHLRKLLRVKAGDFDIDSSVELKNLSTVAEIGKNILNPLEYLHYRIYNLHPGEYKKIINGNSVDTNIPDGTTIITNENRLIAIGKAYQNKLKPEKVFI